LEYFSAVRARFAIMPVSTLQAMATRNCIRNAAGITDIGDMPYELVKPILKKIDNPRQMKEIEDASPHLRELNAEVWKDFIRKHIPKGNTILNEVDIKNPAKWRTYYFKLLKEKEQREKEDELKLEAAMKGLTKEKEESKANFIPKVIPQRQKQGFFVDGQPNPNASSYGIVKPTPGLKYAKSGHDAIAAIRKATQQAVRDRPGWKDKNIMSTTRQILTPKSQIKAAPAWMVQEAMQPRSAAEIAQRNAAQKTGAPANQAKPAIFAPKANKRLTELDTAVQNAEREARLLALTRPKTKPATAAASPSASSAASPPAQAASPPRPATAPKTKLASAAASRPAPGAVSPPAQAVSPPRSVNTTNLSPPASTMTLSGDNPLAKLLNPNPTPIVRKRPAPATSIFMPPKKKKI
jgi:elongin-A